MGDVAAEGERITLPKKITFLAVAIAHFPGEHVDKLGARVLETGKYLALVAHRDEVRLEFLARSAGGGKQLIGMATPGTAPHDLETLARRGVLRAAFGRADILQQQCRADAEHLRESDDRVQTRADAPGLETAQHPRADTRLLRNVRESQAELVADAPRRAANARGAVQAARR